MLAISPKEKNRVAGVGLKAPCTQANATIKGVSALKKLVQQIIKEYEKEGLPITQADAEEIAQMEIKAKQIHNYACSNTKNKKRTSATKQDLEKIDLIKKLYDYVFTIDNNAKIINASRQIDFTVNNNNFSITLVRHKKK